MDTWIWAVAIYIGLFVMQARLVDGGGSGLLSQKGFLLLACASPIAAYFQYGITACIITSGAIVGLLLLVFAPTPRWLRRANWFRAKDVREAVANSRTIWDSYSYRTVEPRGDE